MTESREVPLGAELLKTFLSSKGRGAAARAAEALGVSAPTIHDWAIGVKRPKGPRREALEIWSGGAVPRDSWDLASERDILGTVKPFEDAPASATNVTDVPTSTDDDANTDAAQ